MTATSSIPSGPPAPVLHPDGTPGDAPVGTPAPSASRRRAVSAWGLPPLEEVLGVDDLEEALRAAGGPLSAREIRAALDIPRTYLSGEVSRFLLRAVSTGRVVRSGNAAGTRYRAA